MRTSPPVPRTLLALCALIGLVAALAATTGMLWQGTDAESAPTVTSVRGQTVQLVGEGLYRYDSLLAGAGFRGVDVVVLGIGLPLLAVSAWLAGRQSLRGRLLLVGTLGFFLYQYASMALGAAYNELFLAYIVLFSASLFAFVLAYATIDRDQLASAISPRFPRRAIAIFLFIVAGGLGVLWGAPVVAGLLAGTAPDRLDTYTTFMTHVLDLGVIAPAAVLGGVLVLRQSATGVLLAAVVLVVTFLIGPALTAMTISQLAAGVTFTAGEVIGPVASFTILGLAGMVMGALLLRHVDGSNIESQMRGTAGVADEALGA